MEKKKYKSLPETVEIYKDIYLVKSHESGNKFRIKMGLEPNIRKKRNCLKCEKEFISSSKNNRLCYSCKESVNEKDSIFAQSAVVPYDGKAAKKTTKV